MNIDKYLPININGKTILNIKSGLYPEAFRYWYTGLGAQILQPKNKKLV